MNSPENLAPKRAGAKWPSFSHPSVQAFVQLTTRLLTRSLLFSVTALSFGLLVSGCEWGSIGYNRGYAPEQPIHFSHELHAGQYKVQCLYCHSTAERAAHSAVPSLNICMNCHIVVATDRPEIIKLAEAYNNNKPIAWTKIHMLPDHVKFNHAAHVQKFGAPQACHKCHGPVESMEKMYQYSSLSMGWCVNCHRQPENKAPIGCSTCHH
jgi:hypothetical protein